MRLETAPTLMSIACVGALACSTGSSSTSTDTPDAAASDMSAPPEADAERDVTNTRMYRAAVWADNWSAMYAAGEQVMEDSVSITTERSFNEEAFTFEATPPFVLAVVMKDFIENDSGLEYIGERNQQMGDGGYIAQLHDEETGELVLVSNADWRCLTVHEAPLDTSCEGSADPLSECTWTISEEPDDWMSSDFDDSSWPTATTYESSAVDPKGGYDTIQWEPEAEFIWGSNLETHNTVLCRAWVR